MDLKPFFKELYKTKSITIFPTSVDDLKYKIANIAQTYIGEFHNGSLYFGIEKEPITSDELSDLISMQESDTTDYLNTIKVLGLTTILSYKNNRLLPNTEWVDFDLNNSLTDLYNKKIKNLIIQVYILFTPELYHYNIDVLLSYPEKEDGSLVIKLSMNNQKDLFIKDENIDTIESKVISMSNVNNKKYIGYYASDDGSMDAEVVINKFNLSWNRANVLKYIIRAGKKDPSKEIEDLEKARNYINYEIERLQENKNNI